MFRPRLDLSSRSHGTPTATSRRRRVVRPNLETLEGRVVMNASAVDTSFGTGGLVITSPTDGTGLANPSQTVTAVATQADGKIVTSETFIHAFDSASPSVLLIRQYNANGSVDTSFGTNGQTNIPLPTGYSGSGGRTPHDLVFGPNGSITVGFDMYQSTSSGPIFASLVARLTSTGQLDTGFGTNGVVILPTALESVGNIAVQTNGAIVVAGSYRGPDLGDGNPGPVTLAVARLTTSGALDPSFNGTGVVTYSLGANTVVLTDPTQNIALSSTGEIYTTASVLTRAGIAGITNPGTNVTLLTRINPNGTLDTSYGSGGSLFKPFGTINDLAIQPDGKVILGGSVNGTSTYSSYSVVTRLNTDGSTDSTFQTFSGASGVGIATRFHEVKSLVLGKDGKITLLGDLLLVRLQADGTPDPTFGTNGLEVIDASLVRQADGAQYPTSTPANSLDLTPSGNLVIGGENFLLQYLPITIKAVVNDFDGDGKSDIAAELPGLGIYAYRSSSGAGDFLTGFGKAELGLTIPAPGDFNGDGKSDIGAQLADLGVFAYRSTGAVFNEFNGYGDVYSVSGTPGVGTTIPANGDYDGDGITDRAVYLPATRTFEINFSAQPAVSVPFGIAGDGQSIPAPGDYDGDGKTDLAVYLPSLAALAYRPSSGGADQIIPFGIAGDGASIPTPGDYDGDGKTDLSVYIPSLAIYAYHPSSGGDDVLEYFGSNGDGASIPSPGDYDGDGKTDISVFLPASRVFAYRPSLGGNDVFAAFGIAGTGQTVPTASIPYAQPRSSATTGAFRFGAATPAPPTFLSLTVDLTGPTAKKKTTGTA